MKVHGQKEVAKQKDQAAGGKYDSQVTFRPRTPIGENTAQDHCHTQAETDHGVRQGSSAVVGIVLEYVDRYIRPGQSRKGQDH
jgi:hypothetical protein